MPNVKTPRIMIRGEQRRITQSAKILSLLAIGTPVKLICSQVSCSTRTITKLLKDKDFTAKLEQERDLIGIDATSQSAAIVTDALDAVRKQIAQGDGRLAFDLLKEMGVMRTTGGLLGMEQKGAVDSGQGLQVIINVSSDQFKTNDIIIDAECVVSDHNDVNDGNSN